MSKLLLLIILVIGISGCIYSETESVCETEQWKSQFSDSEFSRTECSETHRGFFLLGMQHLGVNRHE